MYITQKAIEKLKPGKNRLQFMDDELTGLGVRVQPDSGEKTFFWSARIQGKLRFRKLGPFPAVSVEQARLDAQKLIGIASAWKRDGYQGPDPFETKPKAKRASVPTFKELTEAYIARQVRGEANHPERAEADLRGRLKTHFTDWMDRNIDSLTIEDMLQVKNACGKHHIAANRCVELIRRIFNWSAGSKDGNVNFWRVGNPAHSVSLYEEKSRDRFLQPEEMIRFEEALEEEPCQDLKDFLVLSLDTGARKLDVFSMRWPDIQWERCLWSIPRTTKSGEAYDAPLESLSVKILERRRKEIPDSSVWVFPGVGKSGHLMDLKKPWQAFRKRANLPDVHIHDLRRTRASYQAIAGQSLQTIGRTLGHKSMQSTEVYARLQTQAVIDAKAAGTAKMRELMAEAKRRAKKLGNKKPKLLTMACA
jgi:integrase